MALRSMLTCFVILVMSRGVQAAEPIPTNQFSKLHAMIKPQAGEAKWAEIPWITDLWEARKKAAAEGKPIFFRSASGDPLGCT